MLILKLLKTKYFMFLFQFLKKYFSKIEIYKNDDDDMPPPPTKPCIHIS